MYSVIICRWITVYVQLQLTVKYSLYNYYKAVIFLPSLSVGRNISPSSDHVKHGVS